MATKIHIESADADKPELGSLSPGQVFGFVNLDNHLYVMAESYRVCCIDTGRLSVVGDYGATRKDLVLYHTLRAIR